MPRSSSVFYVLPAMLARGAGRVVAGQFVDQAGLRGATENRLHINPAVGRERNDFEIGEERREFLGAFALHRAHDDVLTAFRAPAPFIEHAERFSDARRITEEDLQTPATGLRFFGFDLAEKFFGIGSTELSRGHRFFILTGRAPDSVRVR